GLRRLGAGPLRDPRPDRADTRRPGQDARRVRAGPGRTGRRDPARDAARSHGRLEAVHGRSPLPGRDPEVEAPRFPSPAGEIAGWRAGPYRIAPEENTPMKFRSVSIAAAVLGVVLSASAASGQPAASADAFTAIASLKLKTNEKTAPVRVVIERYATDAERGEVSKA